MGQVGHKAVGMEVTYFKNKNFHELQQKKTKNKLMFNYKMREHRLSRRIFSTNRLCNVAADPPVCPVVLMEVDQSEGVGIHIL